jgi:competence protein ComEA
LLATAALGAVDVNQASLAELEAVRGVGPAIAAAILDERRKGAFKDWVDLVARVKGIGAGSAARFSAAGLTVGGAPFKPAAAATGPDK